MADPLASVILRNTELVEATKDSLAVRGLTLTEATVDHPADQMMAYDALYDSDFVKATLDLQDLPLHARPPTAPQCRVHQSPHPEPWDPPR